MVIGKMVFAHWETLFVFSLFDTRSFLSSSMEIAHFSWTYTYFSICDCGTKGARSAFPFLAEIIRENFGFSWWYFGVCEWIIMETLMEMKITQFWHKIWHRENRLHIFHGKQFQLYFSMKYDVCGYDFVLYMSSFVLPVCECYRWTFS